MTTLRTPGQRQSCLLAAYLAAASAGNKAFFAGGGGPGGKLILSTSITTPRGMDFEPVESGGHWQHVLRIQIYFGEVLTMSALMSLSMTRMYQWTG
jgi:hypothetical protein